MTLVRYNPRNSMSLYEDFDRILDSFFSTTVEGTQRMPKVDIREREGSYTLEAELPGLSEKEVDVRVEENLLTLSTLRREEEEEKKDRYIMRERSTSEYRRSFVLPKDADSKKIEASFKNGLLTLNIPKLPESKPRQIEVKS
ncbi:MAG: Hsp20/alpha crystallin family protein [Spirochaetales bacterium]|nr:Hsp20/alpha crystallin family protein [Spirochaetales bacterium]